jgi:hypothetical protein
MALVAAVARRGARIDPRREDLTASGKNYPVPGNICGSKGALKRSYYVEVECINRRSIDGYKKCFVDI